MIIYYEEFDDITDIVISSDGMTNRPNWKNKQEKAIMDLLLSLFKQVDLKDRAMDDSTKVWTFLSGRGKFILTHLESMNTQGLLPGVSFKKIEDLSSKTKTGTLGRIDRVKEKMKYDEKDFFYTPPTASAGELSGAALISKLVPLLLITENELIKSDDKELKKIYRRAALTHHPDRNNGDGSKMSELNMLWGIYMSQGV